MVIAALLIWAAIGIYIMVKLVLENDDYTLSGIHMLLTVSGAILGPLMFIIKWIMQDKPGKILIKRKEK